MYTLDFLPISPTDKRVINDLWYFEGLNASSASYILRAWTPVFAAYRPTKATVTLVFPDTVPSFSADVTVTIRDSDFAQIGTKTLNLLPQGTKTIEVALNFTNTTDIYTITVNVSGYGFGVASVSMGVDFQTVITPVYEYALIYDMSLKKWGKLKFPHVDIISLSAAAINKAKQAITLIGLDGSSYVLDFAIEPTVDYNHDGIAILGKLEHNRGRLNVLHDIILENTSSNTAFALKVQASKDGKNVELVPDAEIFKAQDAANIKHYKLYRPALNHNIILKGNFVLVGAEIILSDGGEYRYDTPTTPPPV